MRAPDAAHEAVRDLVRAREAASDDLRRKRQQLLSFLLRHSRIYTGGGHWTLAHRRWLAHQKFEHAAQQIVFQEGLDAIEDALQRDGSSPPFVLHSLVCAAGGGRPPYVGATFRPIAHRNAAISRAIAATTIGSFLPVALRRR